MADREETTQEALDAIVAQGLVEKQEAHTDRKDYHLDNVERKDRVIDLVLDSTMYCPMLVRAATHIARLHNGLWPIKYHARQVGRMYVHGVVYSGLLKTEALDNIELWLRAYVQGAQDIEQEYITESGN